MGQNEELERLKRESIAMVKYLKKLRREEKDLRQRNEMIAREALLCGFQPDTLESAPTKQRRKSSAASPTQKAGAAQGKAAQKGAAAQKEGA